MSGLAALASIAGVLLACVLLLRRLPVPGAPSSGQGVSAEGMYLAVACVAGGTLVLASQWPSYAALLPCDQQPLSPPCQNLAQSPGPLALAGLLALALLLLGAVSLLGLRARRPRPSQS